MAIKLSNTYTLYLPLAEIYSLKLSLSPHTPQILLGSKKTHPEILRAYRRGGEELITKAHKAML